MLNETMFGDSLFLMKWRVESYISKIPSIDPEYENSSKFEELKDGHYKRITDLLSEYDKPYFDDMSKTSRRYMEFLLFKFKSNIKLIGTIRNFNYIYKDYNAKFMMINMIAECKALKILLEKFIDDTTEENYIDNKKSKYEDLLTWCTKKSFLSKEEKTKHILENVKEFGLTADIMKELRIPYHSEFREFNDDMSDLLEIQPVYSLIYNTNL